MKNLSLNNFSWWTIIAIPFLIIFVDIFLFFWLLRNQSQGQSLENSPAFQAGLNVGATNEKFNEFMRNHPLKR